MKAYVTCIQDYEKVTQLGELTVTSFNGTVTTIPTPPRFMVTTYKVGEKLTFSSKKAAKQFCDAYSGFFELVK